MKMAEQTLAVHTPTVCVWSVHVYVSAGLISKLKQDEHNSFTPRWNIFNFSSA